MRLVIEILNVLAIVIVFVMWDSEWPWRPELTKSARVVPKMPWRPELSKSAQIVNKMRW